MRPTSVWLDRAKLRQLRKLLRAHSNSEAVRMAIDEELAISMGLRALAAAAEG
jgi:hypothetical protein